MSLSQQMIEAAPGRFTSSEIHKLIGMGKVKMTEAELKAHKKDNPKSRATLRPGGFTAGGETYIDEKVSERMFGQRFGSMVRTSEMVWGDLMEEIVYGHLTAFGEPVVAKGKTTTLHPELGKYWAGSQDFLRLDPDGKPYEVIEVKGYQKKKHTAYARALLSKDLDRIKRDFSQEYWQGVSGACIQDCEFLTLLAYMPKMEDYTSVVTLVESVDREDPWAYRFIVERPPLSLPFIPDDSPLPSLVNFTFAVPKEDKKFLTARVIEAGARLDEVYHSGL